MAAVRGGGRRLLIILIIIGAFGGFLRGGQMDWKAMTRSSSLATSTQHNCVIGDVNVTASLEQQINIEVESNISYDGIRPLVMAARTAIDIIAASSDAVKQGDRLDEIPAAELSIGEEVLIRPWDVWLGRVREHPSS